MLLLNRSYKVHSMQIMEVDSIQNVDVKKTFFFPHKGYPQCTQKREVDLHLIYDPCLLGISSILNTTIFKIYLFQIERFKKVDKRKTMYRIYCTKNYYVLTLQHVQFILMDDSSKTTGIMNSTKSLQLTRQYQSRQLHFLSTIDV